MARGLDSLPRKPYRSKQWSVKLHINVVDFIEEKVHEKHEKRAELEYLLKRISDLKQTDF